MERTDWKPDRRFWVTHAFVPLILAIAVLTFLEHSSLDLWLADRWYALQGGSWLWRDHWLTLDVIHHHGKQMIIAIALGLIVVLLLSTRVPALKRWRRPITYLLICMLAVPALIAFSKRFSQVPCPWDLARYGGDMLYRHNLEYSLAYRAGGYCFPSGHASGGFALLAFYFAALGRVRRPGWFLVPGLLVGWVFALGQQARGAHFLSQDLWTLSLCWFGALLIFRWYKPYLASRKSEAKMPLKEQRAAT